MKEAWAAGARRLQLIASRHCWHIAALVADWLTLNPRIYLFCMRQSLNASRALADLMDRGTE